jgi:CBS domain-containing protein
MEGEAIRRIRIRATREASVMRTNGGHAPGTAGNTRGHTPVSDVRVTDVMSTALLTVGADESLLMAWELMQRAGFRHLPVVDDEGGCVGLLERAELAVACALPATSLAERYVGDLVPDGRQPHVSTSARLADVAGVMTDNAVDALVVTDGSGVLLGLVTARDLVRALAGRTTRHGPGDRGPVLFRLEPVLPP